MTVDCRCWVIDLRHGAPIRAERVVSRAQGEVAPGRGLDVRTGALRQESVLADRRMPVCVLPDRGGRTFRDRDGLGTRVRDGVERAQRRIGGLEIPRSACRSPRPAAPARTGRQRQRGGAAGGVRQPAYTAGVAVAICAGGGPVVSVGLWTLRRRPERHAGHADADRRRTPHVGGVANGLRWLGRAVGGGRTDAAGEQRPCIRAPGDRFGRTAGVAWTGDCMGPATARARGRAVAAAAAAESDPDAGQR